MAKAYGKYGLSVNKKKEAIHWFQKALKPRFQKTRGIKTSMRDKCRQKLEEVLNETQEKTEIRYWELRVPESLRSSLPEDTQAEFSNEIQQSTNI